MKQIRYDDIETLRALVSEAWGPWSETLEVSQDLIQRFADLTGDHNWIHVDVKRAHEESPYGRPIAHGFLTLSLLPSLRAPTIEPFELVGHGGVVNYGCDNVRFTGAVPAGAQVQAHWRLSSVEQTPKGTRLARNAAVHVVGENRPALLCETISFYRRPNQ